MAGDAPHYHPLVRQLARDLRGRCRVQAGATVIVGCSGGADSVALLRALAMLAPRRRWQLKLVVGHIQHHLRDQAEADAAFVKELAQELGLLYERRDIEPGQTPGNTEANARLLRYDALSQIAITTKAQHVATAHHGDDQLETVLMRLLRGASVRGLRGIAWRRRLIPKDASDRVLLVRPMLNVDRAAVLDFLKELDQPWREDVTNKDTTRTRARLRHDIIPLLKALQPEMPGKAQDLAEHAGDLARLVHEQADNAIASNPCHGGFMMPRDQARALNRAVLAQVLRRKMIEAGTPGDQLTRRSIVRAVDAAHDRVGGERRFTFAGGVSVKVTREKIYIES